MNILAFLSGKQKINYEQRPSDALDAVTNFIMRTTTVGLVDVKATPR